MRPLLIIALFTGSAHASWFDTISLERLAVVESMTGEVVTDPFSPQSVAIGSRTSSPAFPRNHG